MFTGIVQSLGQIKRVDRGSDGARITIASELADEIDAGESIAINGVCLTALPGGPEFFRADAMNETLTRTSLAEAGQGTPVNLELPLRPSDRLGGHIVQGHVDGTGTVASVADDRRVRWA
jgi:riboflavin synthase